MDLSKKINIGIFSFMFVFFLGVAIVANAYLWFIGILLLTIGIFYIQDRFNKRVLNTRFTRFFPLIFVALFILSLETSRSYITNNPQSVTVYVDEETDQERVLVEYGIYNSITFETKDLPRSIVDLNVTPSGYELVEPLDVQFEVFVAIYIFLGIPLFLNAIVSFLSQTRSISKNITSRESVFKVIMSSGDRFHSHDPRNAHIQQHQSFIQEDAKKEMVNDNFNNQDVHDEKAKKDEKK